MASKEETHTPAHHEKGAKLAEDFEPNEPTLRTGVDKEGKPNDSLSPKQLERGAAEALLSLRPQPTAEEIQKVLEELSSVDEHGKPKHQVKTAKDAATKAVDELNKRRG